MMALGHTAVCVLSADSPTLPTRLLVRAAEILLIPGERAVLGPAEDGGYYLLGLKTANPMMFADIAWSTASVADETRDRARNLGLPLVELQTWYDVDSAASLCVLMNETSGYAAPETNGVVDLLGLRRALTEATFLDAAE
jgi:glycosyltransferase A (GT-A) superfamily protein (DUF2064 family)